MACPLPPFHVHMHQASCQAKNSLNLVPAGGTGIGEPTEQMNRYLGVAGVVLQYAALASRALWLETLFRNWNLRKSRDLPRLLVDSGFRAEALRQQLSKQQDNLAAQACAVGRELGLLDEGFKQQVGCAYERRGSCLTSRCLQESWQ